MTHTLITFLLLLSTMAQAQVFNLNQILQPNKSIKDAGWKSQAKYFNFNNEVYNQLKSYKGQKATLNIAGIGQLELELWEPHSPDFIVTTSDGKATQPAKGFYFKGYVTGKPTHLAAISIFENEVFGMVSTPSGNYNIGVMDRKFIGKTNALHVVYNDLSLPEKNPFNCHTPDGDAKVEEQTYDTKSAGCRIVNNYFEIDNQGFIQNGSNITTTTNYVNGVFNIIKLLYARDLIQINLSQLHIWTTLDPYPGTSSDAALTAFRTRIQSITYNGNIAHLISLKVGNLGGLAYLNSLCSSTSATNIAYSNAALNYSQFPVYSWTVNVIAHEIGHNLGSNHTHWCGWLWPDGTRRPIDFCGTVEPFGSPTCYTGARIPQSGTIMSYCHTNGSIDFTQGFGVLPSTLMRSRVSTATCLTGYQIEEYSITGTRRVCAGGTINLGVTGITDATYAWTGANGFTSSNQNISVPNASASTVGTYNVAVTKNGCTHTGKDAVVRLNGNTNAPFSQNFEAASAIPTGWEVINPNGDNTWSVTSLAGGFGTSSKSIRAMNYPSPNSTGRFDSLFTPVISLGGVAASQLRFDVAYAQYTGRADTLTILASVNCGTSYQVVYRKGGAELATAPSLVSSYTPTASQWRTETVSLSGLPSASSVQFVFVSRSAYGNYIYLDNINLSTGGVQPPACSFTYSPWTACLSGVQTRTFTASPAGCTGTPPADSLSRTCSIVVPPVQPCTTNLRNIVKPTNSVTAIGTTSPAGEEVAKAIDNNTATKYLNFQGANSGLTINTDTLAIVRALVLVSANDEATRDPRSYQLSGSLDGVNYTLISSGAVALFTARFQSQEIAITNSTAYRHYRLIIPTVVGASCVNCSVMQVAEVRLLACAPNVVVEPQPCTTLVDVTQPSDVVEIVNGSRVDSRPPPLNEEPYRVIDNSVNFKYLNFTGLGSGFIVNVPRTHSPVVQLSITSGNDAPERDPTSYNLQGWNGFVWVQVATGSVPLFTARRQRVVLPVFVNTVSYSKYRVTFPTLRGTSFMQVSEVELLGCSGQAISSFAVPNPTDGITEIDGVKFDLSKMPAGVYLIRGVRVVKK
jgi:hypothetical protein